MKQKLLLLGAVFFGILAFMFTYRQITLERQKIQGEAQDVYLIQVVKDIPEGEKITEDMIRQKREKRFRSQMDYSQRLQLYYFLVSLGASDGLHKKEVEVLERIARGIGISKTEADSVMAQFKPSTDSSYKILEIEPTATDDEVRKAYRKMAVKYHPDKVATLGQDVQKAAEEKFKAVAQAYEAIRKERGF